MLINQRFDSHTCRVLPCVAPTGCIAARAHVDCRRLSDIRPCYLSHVQRQIFAKQQAIATVLCGAAAGTPGELSLGIDCGTSGARSIVIDGKPPLRSSTLTSVDKHEHSCMLVWMTVFLFSYALLVPLIA